MGNDKDAGPGEEVQGHGGDLCRVLVPVFHGQARGHHVTIVDRLHLDGITTQFCFSSGLFHLVNVITVNSGVKEFV